MNKDANDNEQSTQNIMQDSRGIEREKLNDIFAEELTDADLWDSEDRQNKRL